MKIKMKLTIVPLLFTLLFLGCEPQVKTSIKQSIPSQEHLTQSILYTQQSGEYRALCYQAYHLAELKLKEKLEQGPQKPAVLLDIDETILDNSPYTAMQVLEDVPYTPETWAKWVALGKADAIPGVQQFLRVADSLGVQLFYVSNRDTSMVASTLKNMAALGMPQTKPDHYLLKSTTSDKHERRESIRNQGYTILLYIGDNMGDYQSAWDKPATNAERKQLVEDQHSAMGTEFIALPNTMYGTWVGGVYNFNRSLSDSAQYEARLNALKAY